VRCARGRSANTAASFDQLAAVLPSADVPRSAPGGPKARPKRTHAALFEASAPCLLACSQVVFSPSAPTPCCTLPASSHRGASRCWPGQRPRGPQHPHVGPYCCPRAAPPRNRTHRSHFEIYRLRRRTLDRGRCHHHRCRTAHRFEVRIAGFPICARVFASGTTCRTKKCWLLFVAAVHPVLTTFAACRRALHFSAIPPKR